MHMTISKRDGTSALKMYLTTSRKGFSWWGPHRTNIGQNVLWNMLMWRQFPLELFQKDTSPSQLSQCFNIWRSWDPSSSLGFRVGSGDSLQDLGNFKENPVSSNPCNGKSGKPAPPWEGMVFITHVESETQWSGTDENWPNTPVCQMSCSAPHTGYLV